MALADELAVTVALAEDWPVEDKLAGCAVSVGDADELGTLLADRLGAWLEVRVGIALCDIAIVVVGEGDALEDGIGTEAGDSDSEGEGLGSTAKADGEELLEAWGVTVGLVSEASISVGSLISDDTARSATKRHTKKRMRAIPSGICTIYIRWLY